MFFLPVILSMLLSVAKEPSSNASTSSGVDKKLMLQLVNDVRKKGCNCGDTYYPAVAELKWNDQLEKAASLHSADMFKKKYISHTSQQDGSSPAERITKAGYQWSFYGENIAMGYNDEREVMEGWLTSPGHCKNIMSKNFTEMGVARSGSYWTQDFGKK